MCAFQFNFSSMCTPRYIADSWMAIFFLSIMMDLGGFLLFDHRTTWVLRVLISSPLELHHSIIFLTCSVAVCLAISLPFVDPSWIRTRSSAYANMFLCMFSDVSRSSSTRFHRNGDRTPPWGHPFDTCQAIVVNPDLRNIVLDLIMLVIHLIANGSACVFLRLASILSCGRLSKAPWISRKTPKMWPPLLRHFLILFTSLAMAALVE